MNEVKRNRLIEKSIKQREKYLVSLKGLSNEEKIDKINEDISNCEECRDYILAETDFVMKCLISYSPTDCLSGEKSEKEQKEEVIDIQSELRAVLVLEYALGLTSFHIIKQSIEV